jgi:hypothetical protein
MGMLDGVLDPSYSEALAPDGQPKKPFNWQSLFDGVNAAPLLAQGTPEQAAISTAEPKRERNLQEMAHDAALSDLVSQVGGVSPMVSSGYDPSLQPQPAQAPQAPAAQPWTAQTADAPQSPQPLSMAPPAAAPQPQAPVAAPQPAPAPAPQAAGPFKPDFIDRLSAFGRGLADNHGLFGAIGDAAGAQSPLAIEQQNQTYQALVNKGIDPNVAKAAVLNPEILKQVLPLAFPPKAPAIEKIGPDDRLINTVVGPDGRATATDVTPSGDTLSGKTVQSRQVLAPRYGLKPGTPQYQAYILNGKLPDVVPDHKAILEADSQVLQSQHLQEDLEHALQLSQSAYAGPGAETRASIAAQLLGQHPDANATSEYANVVQSSILPGLKTIFPGRVTNADLKLMTELQGSASQPQAVREEILRHGIARAKEIRAEKQAQAKSLRDGVYYKPGGEAQPQAQSSQTKQQFSEGQTATGPNGQKIVFRNGAWAAQ